MDLKPGDKFRRTKSNPWGSDAHLAAGYTGVVAEVHTKGIYDTDRKYHELKSLEKVLSTEQEIEDLKAQVDVAEKRLAELYRIQREEETQRKLERYGVGTVVEHGSTGLTYKVVYRSGRQTVLERYDGELLVVVQDYLFSYFGVKDEG